MANSVDPDQTAPIGTVCPGSTLFASILNLSVMLGNYLQQTTFSDVFFLGALRVNFRKIFQEHYHAVSNCLDPDQDRPQDRHFFGPDLGPHCLQRQRQ